MGAVRPGRERRTGPEGRAREIPALLFALVWVLGFEVGPALHLARHAALPQHDHCHDGVCHDDGGLEVAADDAGDPSGPEHGAGSLEHGGLAALAPAPIVTTVPGVPVAELVDAEAAIARPDDVARDRARARAPPADLSSRFSQV